MRLRFSRRLRFCIIPIAVLMLLLFYFRDELFSNSLFSRRNADKSRPTACKMDPVVQKACFEMAVTVSEKLKLYNVTHFLCYGTLWGALRHENLLSWESRIQFCAMSEDVSRHDEVFFMREFRRFGLKLSYDMKTGTYTVTDENKSLGASVEIHLFERVYDLKLVRRIGWKYRILPPTSEHIDSFPDWLITPPLSTVKLRGHAFPATREGIELQKYHYKDSWWIESKPVGC